jgi:hypothetical protein
MKPTNDETMLSAYLDGELDAAAMSEADMRLEKDEAARRYVLETVRTTAFLRANLKGVLHEESPKRLLDTLSAAKIAKSHRKPMFSHMMRVAAVLILGLLGFGSGMLLERSTIEQFPAFINPLPRPYCEVVDKALEYNLSGTPQKWRAPGGTVDVTVTPVKTYRDKNGVYYREYQLEVASATERSQINGLAYRKLKGEWETKALFILNAENTT